jgi:hypothetical protein
MHHKPFGLNADKLIALVVEGICQNRLTASFGMATYSCNAASGSVGRQA